VGSTGRKFVDVLGAQPFNYEFFVVSEDSINAFAVPGGKIFVHAGLISRAESEDELAGLLRDRAFSRASRSSLRMKGAVANYAALLGIFLSAIDPVLGLPPSRLRWAAAHTSAISSEADFLGIEYAKKAGYQPGYVRAAEQDLRRAEDQPDRHSAVIQSHPLSGERMAYLGRAPLTSGGYGLEKSWRLEYRPSRGRTRRLSGRWRPRTTSRDGVGRGEAEGSGADRC
jgi:predicted Zn-dependent protease